MKQLVVSIPAAIHLTVNVADDATDEQITQAVNETYDAEHGKYVELRAGVDFDVDEFVIIDGN